MLTVKINSGEINETSPSKKTDLHEICQNLYTIKEMQGKVYHMKISRKRTTTTPPKANVPSIFNRHLSPV